MRSLLDNEPYKHEPGQMNNPEFNAFVQYSTWKCLLLDYLDRETDPVAKEWLQRYVRRNGQEILRDLAQQHATNARRTHFSCPYKKVRVQADYPRLTMALQALVSAVQPKPVETSRPVSLAPGPSRPENATLKRKCESETDDVSRSPARAQKQKHNEVAGPPDTTAMEPVNKKRAKQVEVIDLT